MTGDVLIERYVLGALLGKGGAGYVHEAVDLKMQRPVAVKLLGIISPDGESLRRFSREALAAGSLQHPNVVGVFDTGEQQGRPFLVTELLRGETLRQVLRRGAPGVEQARSWAKQLAAGLAAAHDKGLTHRDLKPSNIFITSDGWVKILDFGLVKLTQALQASPDSDTHRIVGTIGYMAPEQVRGQPVDARADLFNFGLVLYELLAGRQAFADVSDTDTSYAIVVREPAPLPAAVPAGLRSLVSRCLAKDREKRPASAREVLRLLDEPAEAPPSRLLPWTLPAAALLALAAAFLLLLLRPAASGPLAGTIAVFPFDTRALPRPSPLADGISELLTNDLDGAELHVADQAMIHDTARPGEPAASVFDRARAKALKLNARYFVLGRAEDRDGELWAFAALHDTQSGRRLAQASAHADPAEFLRLVGSLEAQLQGRELTAPELDARTAAFKERTTSSMPALAAYLEGKHLAETSWRVNEAYAASEKAVELDPGFTWALINLARLTITSDWDLTEDLLTRALRHPERLSFSERIHAQNHLLRLQGKPLEASQLLLGAARERPDDPIIWRHVGAWLFHRGPFMGRSPQESASAFQRQYELNPADLEPIGHLLDLAVLRGEREVARRLADRLFSLGGPVERADTLALQILRAWAARDTAGHEKLLAQLRARANELSPDARVIAINRLELLMDGSSLPSELAALVPLDASTATLQRFEPGFTPVAHTSLMRGRIGDARRAMAAFAGRAEGDRDFYLPWIDTLELVQATPAQLKESRAAAARLDVTDPRRAPAKQHLIGLLALRAGDLEGAKAALQALRSVPELPRSSIVADLALSLQARIAAAEGDPKAALALFDQQKMQIPERYFHFYGRPRESFFRAGLLVALGRPREALPLYEALAIYDLVDPVFSPAAQLYTARIYDSLGETERAILGYERFTAMWKDCDPEEQPELRSAQARLLELRGARPLEPRGP